MFALARERPARAHARRHEEIALTLNAHQAVHAVGLWLVVEEATGGWREIRALAPRVERAVGANAGTPCSVNPISFLICAVAHAYLGDAKEAVRFEEAASTLGMEGYGMALDGLRARLALIRGDLTTVERLLDESSTWAGWWFGHLSSLAVRLDGFVALGRREEVEQEASRLAQSSTYLEPFALRALGTVRGDRSLIDRAADRFEAMGLAWHAGQTRAVAIP